MRVTVIAANGPSFCAGYDLTQNVTRAGPAVPAADGRTIISHLPN